MRYDPELYLSLVLARIPDEPPETLPVMVTTIYGFRWFEPSERPMSEQVVGDVRYMTKLLLLDLFAAGGDLSAIPEIVARRDPCDFLTSTMLDALRYDLDYIAFDAPWSRCIFNLTALRSHAVPNTGEAEPPSAELIEALCTAKDDAPFVALVLHSVACLGTASDMETIADLCCLDVGIIVKVVRMLRKHGVFDDGIIPGRTVISMDRLAVFNELAYGSGE